MPNNHSTHAASLISRKRISRIVLVFSAMLLACSTVDYIDAAGLVVGWGDNSHGQRNIPSGLTNAMAVAGGTFHSLALKSDGTVVAWGDNTYGQLTPTNSVTNATSIAAGNGLSLALRSTGGVAGWGSLVIIPGGFTNLVALAANGNNELFLTSDGNVTVAGTTYSASADVTNVIAISAGSSHGLALRGDGSVVAWGDGSLGKTSVPAGLSGVVALAAGNFHSLALKADGTVVGWGDNTYGESAVPAGLSGVVAIAAGALNSLALKSDGTVVTWGDNTYGQSTVPPSLAGVTAIAGGRYHALAIIGDGSPVITVQPVAQYDPTNQTALFRVMAIGAPPLSYQWQRDGADIPGATNPALTLMNLPTSNAGLYSVIVTNSVGSVTSSIVTLPPVWRRPSILTQPQDLTIHCGDTATFGVTLEGTKPFSYQWLFEGNPIQDATNSTLMLDRVSGAQTGSYSVVVTNVNGAITSTNAVLTILGEPPLVTSPLTASGKQGVPFTYTITGMHQPDAFDAFGLPGGLNVNGTNGVISGTPLESGTFLVTLTTASPCASASTNLTLTITSSIPVITSALSVTGGEQVAFNYRITATESPTSFGAQNLPQGLNFNSVTGIISGASLYAGAFDAMISASNRWGIGSTNLHLVFSNAPISELSIENVITNYSSPYLLDFQFSLRDGSDPSTSHAIIAAPRLLTAEAFEDNVSVSPSETAVIIQSANAKLLKAYLVLDFSESIGTLANGDANNDGISDAVDTLVSSAQAFVTQQPVDAQMGVYEFHRDDRAPQKVISLTTDKAAVNSAIGGIWTNYVQWFSAGSRCWDALGAAVGDFGPTNRDENHYVVFISDGRDESSTNTVNNVIRAATNANVHIYCVGFGNEMDTNTLQSITSQTQGRFYVATNVNDLAIQFSQIGKDLGGQYILRWATLKRSTNTFMPSFQITYQGITALSPSNPPPMITGTNITSVTNDADGTVTMTTNFLFKTNYTIPPYSPAKYAGDVTVGSLRLVSDADVHPSGITLRATYIPRYIRQLQLHYRANWPCTTSLQSTNLGEMLYGWTRTETDDGAGGKWVLLSSPNPQSITNSLPFASFGKLLTFSFRDVIRSSDAFSFFAVDNTIYTNTGNQKFLMENTNLFVVNYPVLPYGTPVPWLLDHGFSINFITAEVSDPDNDGMLTWQEYVANTDPQSAGSNLAITTAAPTGPFGRYQITFNTALNRTYRVEVSADLVNWQTVQDKIQGTGGSVTVTDNLNPPVRDESFYRVVVY